MTRLNKGKKGAPPKKGPASDGFDPEGSGYDYENAPPPSFKELGYFPKYGSLNPKTGMVLKGRKHKTYDKTLKAEEDLGNKIIKKGDRYFSVKKKVFGGRIVEPKLKERPVKKGIVKKKNTRYKK